MARLYDPKHSIPIALAAVVFSSPAFGGPPKWLKDRFGLKTAHAEELSCPDQLLETSVASVFLAVEIQRPIALLVSSLAEKNWTVYEGVPADAVSRAAARSQYEAFEVEVVEDVMALGPRALPELFAVFNDPSQALPLRRAALRLLLITPDSASQYPALVSEGTQLIDVVVHGKSSHSDRTLASDMIREFGKLRRPDPTVRSFLDLRLKQVLSGYTDQTTQQKIYSDQLRTDLLHAWLRRADFDEYTRLALHLADPVLQGHPLVEAMVSISNAFDRILDDVAIQERVTPNLISVFQPALVKALFHLQVKYPIGLDSPSLPGELAWNEDLGALIGLLHLGGTLQPSDSLHPAQFFRALANHSDGALLTPAQRYLVRNFCHATIIGRVPEASFLGFETSMAEVLERLSGAVESLPPLNSEIEGRGPLEYNDLHFLLIAMPWSLFSDTQKQELVGRFQSGAKYGWGIASTADRILEKKPSGGK